MDPLWTLWGYAVIIKFFGSSAVTEGVFSQFPSKSLIYRRTPFWIFVLLEVSPVDAFEGVPSRHGDFGRASRPITDRLQTAILPEFTVGREAVITTPLDVVGHQVHEAKHLVGDIGREESIHIHGLLVCHPGQDPVHATPLGLLDQWHPGEEALSQWDWRFLFLAVNWVAPVARIGNLTVAKPGAMNVTPTIKAWIQCLLNLFFIKYNLRFYLVCCFLRGALFQGNGGPPVFE